MNAVLDELGWQPADLARRLDVDPAKIRKYRQGGVDQPRGEMLSQIALALGVELLWLRDGIEPKRAGDRAAADPAVSGDEVLHRRAMAQRIAGARARRGIATPELAALGTIIDGRRWRRIEMGEIAPTPLELQVISDRLHESLDWLVSGHATPIDSSNPVEVEKARRAMHEQRRPPPTRP